MFKKNDKNKTKTFIDGRETDVPQKIPELKVPIPPEEEKIKQDFKDTKEVFEEGRSVGFQEGMIYSLNIINEELLRIQSELKKQLDQEKKV